MLSFQFINEPALNLMGEATPPPSLIREQEIDLWLYRPRTVALLRRYARASVELGRLPSLVGRQCFRSRLTSYAMSNFEDVVIFVADMDRALTRLSPFEQKLIAMGVIEDYTIPEVSRLLRCPQRTVERLLQEALDELTKVFLEGGLLDRLLYVPGH